MKTKSKKKPGNKKSLARKRSDQRRLQCNRNRKAKREKLRAVELKKNDIREPGTEKNQVASSSSVNPDPVLVLPVTDPAQGPEPMEQVSPPPVSSSAPLVPEPFLSKEGEKGLFKRVRGLFGKKK